MNSSATKSRPSHREVVEQVIGEAMQNICEVLAISEAEFTEAEYEWGCQLPVLIFHDLEGDEFKECCDMLIESKAYWMWFKMQRRMNEVKWLASMDNKSVKPERFWWRWINERFLESEALHKRTEHFIQNTKKL